MSHQHYAFTLPDDPGIRTVKLRNSASARYGGDWHSIPHTHGYTELFYVVAGAGQFNIDGDLFPVKTNQLVIVNPNILHTEVSYGDHPLEYIVVGVEGPELAMHEDHDGRFCLFDVPEQAPILQCMQSILREMQNRQQGYETICQAYTEILIVQLMRTSSFTLIDPPVSSPVYSQCASVRHYIENHFKEHLTLDHLAAVANMNKFHLSHIFKKEFGVSPMSYMNSCRNREGKRLLMETNLSLSQVSSILGYSSPSYFSQAFRNIEGCSPQEYRKLHHSDEQAE